MAAAPPTTRPNAPPPGEPKFLQRYSPHGELPLASTASVALHLALLGAAVLIGLWFVSRADENSKPPIMDVVDLEPAGGNGGGLGGNSVGPGKLDNGPAGKAEGIPNAKGGGKMKSLPDDIAKKINIKDLPEYVLKGPGDIPSGPIGDEGDVWLAMDQQRLKAQKQLEAEGDGSPGDGKRPGFPGGEKGGPAGGKGGPKGPGDGTGKGPYSGPGAGKLVLTEQRRRELRWVIMLAQADGWDHIKKLQALRVTLVVPLKSKAGYALEYDLSKPGLQGREVRFSDDDTKVRWFAKPRTAQEMQSHEGRMASLAKALKLREVPPFTVIYLPSDLEADMARKELAFAGRQENEIQVTVWDVRQRDGVYENEPYIVSQKPKAGAR
jgi:hypothetical protein